MTDRQLAALLAGIRDELDEAITDVVGQLPPEMARTRTNMLGTEQRIFPVLRPFEDLRGRLSLYIDVLKEGG